MAEAKTEPKAAIAQKYIAKEDCFYKGRFLKRGEIILLESRPDHACIVDYTGKEKEVDTGFFDPIQESIERERLKSAMASFM